MSCALMLSGTIFSQTVLDSVTVAQLKKEIKEELRAEMAADTTPPKTPIFSFKNFSLKGYGAMNYYHFNFDTDPSLKDKIDLERLNLYLGYSFSEKISLNSEIEFEHGGTGASIGYDTQEEFGEFEDEIEKGGSVKLEQLYVDFKIAPYFNVRAGRMKVYFGLSQKLDEPTSYFTTYRPEMENEILPLGWYENGISFYGTFAKRFSYKAYIVSGLDASGFSSRGWIKNGYQQRFEMNNAESFAFAGRLDYHFGSNDHTFIGIAGYVNDSAANRPKKDMKQSAYVTMVEGHVSYDEKNLRFNAVALYGNLENSDIVSQKNANLSNNLGVKRTPVGKNAFGVSVEAGYNVLPLLVANTSQKLYPFLRYDYYDTMQDVEGAIVKNPRWERSAITGGINWFVHPQIVVKAHYSDRKLGSENYDPSTLQFTGSKQHEKTFSAGIGFTF
jgi:hypothetical protein